MPCSPVGIDSGIPTGIPIRNERMIYQRKLRPHDVSRPRGPGKRRGREAAALDAAGAAMGALGLLAFAGVFWSLVERSVTTAFIGASLVWLIVSMVAWFVRRRLRVTRMDQRDGGPAMSRSR